MAVRRLVGAHAAALAEASGGGDGTPYSATSEPSVAAGVSEGRRGFFSRVFPEARKVGVGMTHRLVRGAMALGDSDRAGTGPPIKVDDIAPGEYTPQLAASNMVLSIIGGARARANNRYMRDTMARQRQAQDYQLESARAAIQENTPSVDPAAVGLKLPPGTLITRREALHYLEQKAGWDSAERRSRNGGSPNSRAEKNTTALRGLQQLIDGARNEYYNIVSGKWEASDASPGTLQSRMGHSDPADRAAAYRGLGLLNPAAGTKTPDEWESQFNFNGKDRVRGMNARGAAIEHAASGIRQAWQQRTTANISKLPIDELLRRLPPQRAAMIKKQMEELQMGLSDLIGADGSVVPEAGVSAPPGAAEVPDASISPESMKALREWLGGATGGKPTE